MVILLACVLVAITVAVHAIGLTVVSRVCNKPLNLKTADELRERILSELLLSERRIHLEGEDCWQHNSFGSASICVNLRLNYRR